MIMMTRQCSSEYGVCMDPWMKMASIFIPTRLLPTTPYTQIIMSAKVTA